MEKKFISKMRGLVIKKQEIVDDRGKILHMLRTDDNEFKKFGEIYFSFVNPQKLKHGIIMSL